MTLMRRFGFGELPTMADRFGRLVDESIFGPEWTSLGISGPIVPRLDVYATKDAFVVKVALPGVPPEKVETVIDGDTLTIHGRFVEELEKEEAGYLARELYRGEFRRSLVLPAGLKTDATEAVFEHGVLILTIPKTEAAKPHRIQVKAR